MSAYRFRPFRNTDPPALVELWNGALPTRNVVRPLDVHEFDALVIGKLNFDREGLIVAERGADGKVVGFAHAGFGPARPEGPSHAVDTALGTTAMWAVSPGLDAPEFDRDLFLACERYLRRRGASVFYAGGRHPVDPFYWGLYGGSEFSGVLGDHESFRRAAGRAGYEPVSESVLLEFDLEAKDDPRDPRATVLKRQVRIEVVEDTPPLGWWASLALGPFRPTSFRMLGRSDPRPIARALSWEIASGFGGDRNRTGLIEFEVEPEFRRKGYGRLLLLEVLRHSRNTHADVVCVQTLDTNGPALRLYETTGFERVERATLYRLPAELAGRSR